MILYAGFSCSATSVESVFWQLLPNQISSNQSDWFSEFGMSVVTICSTYLHKLWRLCRFFGRILRAKQCEAQWGTVESSSWFFQTHVITLLQCNVIEKHFDSGLILCKNHLNKCLSNFAFWDRKKYIFPMWYFWWVAV